MCEFEIYRGVKMMNDAKFEEELTCQFKFDMSNFMNLEWST